MKLPTALVIIAAIIAATILICFGHGEVVAFIVFIAFICLLI